MVLINFFTFNMGGTHDENWETIFKTQEWQNLFRKYGIWVVCTQEDSRESKFMKGLQSTIFSNYLYHIKTPTHVYMFNFHVQLGVFVPREYVNTISLIPQIRSWYQFWESGDCTDPKIVCHTSSLYHESYNGQTIKNKFYHKSSAIIDIGNKIRIVGAHLPFNPDDESDVKMREKAFDMIFSNSKHKLMFILGDLNFRIVDGTDQLTKLITKYGIVDITANIHPTCKTQILDNVRNCFNGGQLQTNIQNFDKTNVDLELKFISEGIPQKDKSCFVTRFEKHGNIVHRSPSKCDRILMVNGFYKNYAEPVTIYPINYSDHNAVYGWVELDDGVLSGGKIKKKLHILGRERLLTKEGRKYMLTYKKKRISLAEARKLEKELSRIKINNS